MSRAKPDAASAQLPSGEVRFYDNYEAPLEAGDYSIAATQHVQNTPDGLAPKGQPLNRDIPAGGPAQQLFTVVAPRFRLDPADVQSVFPPDSGSGTFDQNLPHVVLTKRGLPWERYLVEGNKTTPWLAVLLFSPDEVVPPADASSQNPLANPSRAGTYYLSEVINPPAGTFGPQVLQESEDLLDRVTGLRLTQGGAGYTSAPEVVISGGGGSGATATATVEGGEVSSLTLVSPGSGYTSDPAVTFSGGGGSGAAAQALRGLLCRAIDVPTSVFTRVTPRFTTGGQSPFDELQYLAHVRQVSTDDKELQATKDDGWFSVVIGNRFPSPGAGAVLRLTLGEAGENYTSAPEVALTGGGGSGATAIAGTQDGVVVSLTLTGGGSGYTEPPTVAFSGGGGTGATATAQIGAPWVAHLVTLEGFADYLTDSPAWPQGVERVRVVSLYSWSFTCLSETGDFRDLMLNLIAGQARGGEGLLLRLPVPDQTREPSDAETEVRQALGAGYTALRYDTLVGDHTFAWYRGPLLPAPRPAFQNIPPYASASAAMVYDQTAGLFDQSYAAAWQTGRLLALSDASFGTNLLQWRRVGARRVNLLLERLNSPRLNAPSADAAARLGDASPQTVSHLRTLLRPSLVSETLEGRLTGDFSVNAAARLARAEVPAHGPGLRPALRATTAAKTGASDRVAAIKDLHAQPAVRQLLTELNEQDADDPDSPLSYVCKWLTELCLLYNVPFVNLVPDARMLPAESLRFFYVDPNYLEALIDGALSIGLQSSRDGIYQAMSRPTLRAAVERALPAVRARLAALRAGRPATASPQPTDDPLPTPSQTMAGLLLRSAVVSGWPGLEVRGYGDAAGTASLTPLRIERLAPDVLLCLFPQAPARVEISEPKEGLAFGHEDDFIVPLRWVTNDPPDRPIGSIIPGHDVTVDGYFRAPAPGPVLNVRAWQPHLNQQLDAAYGGGGVTLGPAGFAIQMVRAPEEFVLNNALPASGLAEGAES